MKKFVLAIFIAASMLAVGQAQMVFAQSAEPDFDLAYILATASYCAYAVGEVDSDHGQQRAVQCLKATADGDRDHLEVLLDVTQDNVEAYFNPDSPEDAYLLIQTRNGVILAFRGTLTPPISPSGGRFPSAVADAIAKYKEREVRLLATFVGDWRSNFNAIPDTQNRHRGFEAAWSGLKNHLMARDCVAQADPTSLDCSKFLIFVGRLHAAVSLRLYVTGHSKGGAVATLAALDLPHLVGTDIIPVVYTFAAAKALTTDGANQSGVAVNGMWRFEHESDIVPTVPPDRTVTFSSSLSYAHLGSRAFFRKGQPPQLSSGPVQGVDPPGDRERLTGAVAKLFSSGWQLFGAANFIQSVFGLGEVNCQALVDNHFLVFADVQEAVHAKHDDAHAPITITEANLNQSFFVVGLSDSKGEILWGFSQWCALLKGPEFGPGQAPKSP
jgi:hypothetical protein